MLIADITYIINEDSLNDQNKVDRIKFLLQKHLTIKVEINKQNPTDNKNKFRQLLTDNAYSKLLEDQSLALQRRVST